VASVKGFGGWVRFSMTRVAEHSSFCPAPRRVQRARILVVLCCLFALSALTLEGLPAENEDLTAAGLERPERP
jgi:hypothetical protein